MEDFPADRRPGPQRGQPLPAAMRQPQRDAVAPPPPREDEATLDLGALFATVWRQKLVIAVFGFAFAFLAMVAVYAVTPRYQATTTVMLDQTNEQFIDVESVVTGLSADFYSIAAEEQVLLSRKLLERVVKALDLTARPLFNPELAEPSRPPLPIALLLDAADAVKAAVRGAVSEGPAPGSETLDPEYRALQTAIDRLLKMLSVQIVGNTYVYAVTVETPDPLLSTQIANKHAELYILDQLETKFEATQAATDWLANRVAELKIELERSESEVEAYNSSTTLVSETALAAMNRQLKELRERRTELIAAAREAAAEVVLLRAGIAAGDYAGVAEAAGLPRLDALARDIAALRGDAARADQLADLEARFAGLTDALLARRAEDRTRNLRQVEAIDASIDSLQTELGAQTADLVELRQLQREAEANSRIYEQFLRRLNETSVQEGVHRADARLLSPAVASFTPSYPRKTLSVLVAGFFGGLVGIAFVLVADRSNRAFRTAEEMARFTGLSVLGSIPAAPVRSRRSLLTYSVDRPSSSLMEAVRNMRTGLLLANVDNPPQVVMLTSSLPKEGKTTCSLLLAQNAAALGRKVLLIECDLRRRTFRTYFNFEGEHGLMSLLSGAAAFDDVVHHDAATGLDVVPGEETKANAADVFSSRRFAEFIEQARARYDFVVVDTPPVLAVPDARVIAPLADAVLYCVRWNSTHRDLVRDGLQAFSSIGVRVAGLALTQINTRKMASYGYGGYGYYYYKTSNRYYRD